jgi:hypothetical protein
MHLKVDEDRDRDRKVLVRESPLEGNSSVTIDVIFLIATFLPMIVCVNVPLPAKDIVEPVAHRILFFSMYLLEYRRSRR